MDREVRLRDWAVGHLPGSVKQIADSLLAEFEQKESGFFLLSGEQQTGKHLILSYIRESTRRSNVIPVSMELGGLSEDTESSIYEFFWYLIRGFLEGSRNIERYLSRKTKRELADERKLQEGARRTITRTLGVDIGARVSPLPLPTFGPSVDFEKGTAEQIVRAIDPNEIASRLNRYLTEISSQGLKTAFLAEGLDRARCRDKEFFLKRARTMLAESRALFLFTANPGCHRDRSIIFEKRYMPIVSSDEVIKAFSQYRYFQHREELIPRLMFRAKGRLGSFVDEAERWERREINLSGYKEETEGYREESECIKEMVRITEEFVRNPGLPVDIEDLDFCRSFIYELLTELHTKEGFLSLERLEEEIVKDSDTFKEYQNVSDNFKNLIERFCKHFNRKWATFTKEKGERAKLTAAGALKTLLPSPGEKETRKTIKDILAEIISKERTENG